MEIFHTIQRMYPTVNQSNLEVIMYADGKWEISKWNLPDQQPTKEEIEEYWEDHMDEILSANQPQKTEFEILKETVDQLVLSNLMGGL